MVLEASESKTDSGTFARTEFLFSLIETKRGLLSELRGLAILQSEAVERGDVSELLNLLGRKQGLMDRLMVIQEQMRPFADEDPETRVWSSPQRRQACQANKRVCDQWLSEILVMEQRSSEHMTAQRDAVSSQLHQVADAMRLSRAYGFGDELPTDDAGALSLDG